MNKLFIVLMFVLTFVLTASTVSAEPAVQTKNLTTDYNELSATELFYGIPAGNVDYSAGNSRNVLDVIPEDNARLAGNLNAPEFFFGYSIPDRLEATSQICDMSSWDRSASAPTVSEVSNNAIFFGYSDTVMNSGNCSNC